MDKGTIISITICLLIYVVFPYLCMIGDNKEKQKEKSEDEQKL